MPTSLDQLCDETARRYPLIAGGLISKWSDPDSAHWRAAERALGYLSALPHVDDDFTDSIDKFAQTSIDFLRLQARFLKTGRYACSSSDSLVADLYGNAEEMQGHYLDGLAMTYALWPNHAAMLGFLDSEFTPLIEPDGLVFEIGPGHGMLGWSVLDRRDDVRYVGLDISASALQFVEAAFVAHSIDHARTSFIEADITGIDSDELPLADAVICCEVLEHVDEPERILEGMRRRLRNDGVAFVSTVANLEAVDHVYLFEDAEQIRDLIGAAGFEIEREQALAVPGSESWGVEAINYSAILRPRPGRPR